MFWDTFDIIVDDIVIIYGIECYEWLDVISSDLGCVRKMYGVYPTCTCSQSTGVYLR